MDNALQILLSYQFLLYCLAITALTYVITIVVNYGFSVKGYIAKQNHLWTELILPILPVVLGSAGALITTQYPFPAEITSESGRFAFGLVAGLLSGFAWRWVKSMINNKIKALNPSTEENSTSGTDIQK